MKAKGAPPANGDRVAIMVGVGRGPMTTGRVGPLVTARLCPAGARRHQATTAPAARTENVLADQMRIVPGAPTAIDPHDKTMTAPAARTENALDDQMQTVPGELTATAPHDKTMIVLAARTENAQDDLMWIGPAVLTENAQAAPAGASGSRRTTDRVAVSATAPHDLLAIALAELMVTGIVARTRNSPVVSRGIASEKPPRRIGLRMRKTVDLLERVQDSDSSRQARSPGRAL